MTKEELEILSYTDLAYMILKEEQKQINTPDIFKKICDLLGYTKEQYTDLIGDFYTSLVTDKRFILLNGLWDLQEKHDIIIDKEDDDDDVYVDLYEDVLEEETEEVEEEEPLEEDIDVDEEDDLSDLTIVDEDEE